MLVEGECPVEIALGKIKESLLLTIVAAPLHVDIGDPVLWRGVGSVGNGSNDAPIATTSSSQGPPEIRIRSGVCGKESAVGGYYVNFKNIINTKAHRRGEGASSTSY
jgi:hypothetical protein